MGYNQNKLLNVGSLPSEQSFIDELQIQVNELRSLISLTNEI